MTASAKTAYRGSQPETEQGSASDLQSAALQPPAPVRAVLHPRLVEARRSGTIQFTIPDGVVSPHWRDNMAQRVGAAHMLLMKRMILGDPTGVGKTPQVLITWGILLKKLGWPVLVLTRQANLEPWLEKAVAFIPATRGVIYHGENRESVLTAGVNHVVSTYETVAMNPEPIYAFFQGCPKVVIFDEAHRIRNWARQVTVKTVEEDGTITRQRKTRGVRREFFEELTKDSEYVLGLTATPASGRVSELAGLLDLVVPGLFGGPQQFEQDFVKDMMVKPKGKRWFRRTPKRLNDYKNIPQLQARIEPYFLSRPVSAFDAVLPSIDRRIIDLQLEPDHQKLYNSVVDGLLPATEDRDEKLLADISKHTHLQQILDVPEILGYKTKKLPIKAQELLRMLKEEHALDKVLIYSRYERVVVWLHDLLKKEKLQPVGMITGAVSDTARTRARDRFNRHQTGPTAALRQSSGDAACAQLWNLREGETGCGCQLLITNAGSEALDLQAARVVVLYDLPWGPDELTQIVGRARRVGSVHQNVLVYILTCLRTVDQRTLKLLKTKNHTTSTFTTLSTPSPLARDTNPKNRIHPSTTSTTPTSDSPVVADTASPSPSPSTSTDVVDALALIPPPPIGGMILYRSDLVQVHPPEGGGSLSPATPVAEGPDPSSPRGVKNLTEEPS